MAALILKGILRVGRRGVGVLEVDIHGSVDNYAGS